MLLAVSLRKTIAILLWFQSSSWCSCYLGIEVNMLEGWHTEGRLTEGWRTEGRCSWLALLRAEH